VSELVLRGEVLPGDQLTLFDIANHEHALCQVAVESAVQHAIRAGEALIEAKKRVAHGEWLGELRANFVGSIDLAEKYMRLARNSERVLNLTERSIRKALAALSDSTIASLTSSESDEWYTPAEYIAAAREVLGGIDLDPASCEEANRTVGATVIYTIQENGLDQPWRGRVYTNPPYGGQAPKFMDKLRAEYEAGNVPAAIAFLNAYSTDAKWFQPLFDYAVCFVAGRIPRIEPGGKVGNHPTFGSAFVYLGPDCARFARIFGRFGAVVERVVTA
jgi:DNA N-6-adenine-methyltransferase (Dam)